MCGSIVSVFQGAVRRNHSYLVLSMAEVFMYPVFCCSFGFLFRLHSIIKRTRSTTTMNKKPAIAMRIGIKTGKLSTGIGSETNK